MPVNTSSILFLIFLAPYLIHRIRRCFWGAKWHYEDGVPRYLALVRLRSTNNYNYPWYLIKLLGHSVYPFLVIASSCRKCCCSTLWPKSIPSICVSEHTGPRDLIQLTNTPTNGPYYSFERQYSEWRRLWECNVTVCVYPLQCPNNEDGDVSGGYRRSPKQTKNEVSWKPAALLLALMLALMMLLPVPVCNCAVERGKQNTNCNYISVLTCDSHLLFCNNTV